MGSRSDLEEWDRITRLYNGFEVLCRDIWSGRIAELPPRSVLWKVLLIYRTCDRATWEEKDNELGKRYALLKDKYGDMKEDDNDPLNVKETLNDPLSHSVYDSSELLPDIIKDVERTFPEKDFFRNDNVQEALTRMLYFYSRTHMEIGYRQGMHELLGPFLYVLTSGDPARIEHVESMVYAMFELIMEHAKQWYAQSHTSAPPPIVAKAQHIQENIIKPADPQLHGLLVEYAIEPQIWAIRWVRLLFSREFGFEKTMELWDALFAAMESTDLSELVDYVCATMLIRIRSNLLKDPAHAEILTTILNYPISPETDTTITDLPFNYVANAQYLKRNPSVLGGRHLAEHYKDLFPQPTVISPPHSPRINLESLVDAAKSYSQKWEIDRRLKDAVNGTRRRARDLSNHSTHSSISDIGDLDLNGNSSEPQTRNEALAETLSNSLNILEKLDLSHDEQLRAQKALDGIRQVRQCLLNPDKPHVVVKQKHEQPTTPPTKSSLPQTSLSTSSRNKTPKKSLAQSEFSWMLASPKQTTSHEPSGKFNATKDLFELS